MINYLLHGLLNFSFWGNLIYLLLMTHVTVVATTIYLHRSQAHRALDLHPIAGHFFRFWLWFTTATNTKEWVAVHRKHHAKCETKDDPHSPQVLGLPKVFFEGYELYKEESKNQDTLDRYGHGTPNDWLENNLYKPFTSLGIFILLGMNLVLFGIPGLTIWALQMIWIPVFAAGVINGIGHYWGYRNFECPDQARNIVPWSILTAGEELHNNHHTFATSAKLSVKPWEFDLGWFYIRMLQIFGLAKVKRLPPKLIQASEKSAVDLEILKIVIANRFQVMAHYSREVILPLLGEERIKAKLTGKNLFKRCKGLLVRADNLLDDLSKQRIASILENSHTLKLAYHYRQKLQDIWNRTTANQRELLEALQEWCKEAEATGIMALRSFVTQLRRYSIPQTLTAE